MNASGTGEKGASISPRLGATDASNLNGGSGDVCASMRVCVRARASMRACVRTCVRACVRDVFAI